MKASLRHHRSSWHLAYIKTAELCLLNWLTTRWSAGRAEMICMFTGRDKISTVKPVYNDSGSARFCHRYKEVVIVSSE